MKFLLESSMASIAVLRIICDPKMRDHFNYACPPNLEVFFRYAVEAHAYLVRGYLWYAGFALSLFLSHLVN